jgi:gamma-glutamyl:cysteine ligase YbdK (ATP-grasp superfamily)
MARCWSERRTQSTKGTFSMNPPLGETKKLVDKLYEHVLHVVNRMLHNAQNFNISLLKLEDPSYREIAEQLAKACTIMELLADDLQRHGGTDEAWTVSKAKDYTQQLLRMAKAIENEDEAALRQLCEELNARSFL